MYSNSLQVFPTVHQTRSEGYPSDLKCWLTDGFGSLVLSQPLSQGCWEDKVDTRNEEIHLNCLCSSWRKTEINLIQADNSPLQEMSVFHAGSAVSNLHYPYRDHIEHVTLCLMITQDWLNDGNQKCPELLSITITITWHLALQLYCLTTELLIPVTILRWRLPVLKHRNAWS